MSAIDQYNYTVLGSVVCPSSYEIVFERDIQFIGTPLRIPIYRLDQDIPPDEFNFRGKRGDILLGGGSGEAPALHVWMPESLFAWTDSDQYPPVDKHEHADFAKAFWTPNEAFKFCEGYAKLGWTPDTTIEYWLMEHLFAFLVQEYPEDYARYVGPEPLEQDGSICSRLTEADDRILNWKRYR